MRNETVAKLFLVKPRPSTRPATPVVKALEIAARIPFEQFARDVGDSAWSHYRSLIERLDNGTLSLDESFSGLDPDELVACLVYSSIKDEKTGEVRNELIYRHAREVVDRWTANTGPKKLPVKQAKGGAI